MIWRIAFFNPVMLRTFFKILFRLWFCHFLFLLFIRSDRKQPQDFVRPYIKLLNRIVLIVLQKH